MDAVARAASDRAPLARAEIIAVGSELLTPTKADTNSLFVTGVLNELGIEVRAKAIVGDRLEDVAAMVRLALSRADLVVLTGGLGPTDDDVTRDAVARVLEREMREDPAIVVRLRERFAQRGLTMPEINRRQAFVPEGAVPLDNVNGTAPGLWIEQGDLVVLLLPGPPRELQPMMRTVADGLLAGRVGKARLLTRVVRITGRTESHTEEAVQPCYARWAAGPMPVEATILATYGQIELHLTVRTEDIEAGRATLEQAVADVRAAIGDDVFSVNGESLPEVVGMLLRQHGLHIAAAESCTGGLLTSRLTDVPGSSDYVDRSVIVYSYQAKTDMLGVPTEMLLEHGAVSEPVAAAMAEGIRYRARVEIGIGITGIAGPGGGTPTKPVGTVAIAMAGPDAATQVRTLRFAGDRGRVKFQSTQTALDMVRRVLASRALPAAPSAPSLAPPPAPRA
jgi:nicotinamide-nucleotide amidase